MGRPVLTKHFLEWANPLSLPMCGRHTWTVPFRLLAVPLGPGQGCQVEGQRGEDEGAEVEVERGDEEGDGDGDVRRHGDQLEDEEPEEAAQGAGAPVHDAKHRPRLQGFRVK